MKKTLLKKVIIGLIISNIFSSQLVLAADNTNYEEINKGITSETKEEVEASEKKIKEAEEYVTRKKMMRTANNIKVLQNYKRAIQDSSYLCGPYAAYNATNGVMPVSEFKKWLGTTYNGTNFPGMWVATMDIAMPGNAYVVSRAPGKTYESWRAVLKNAIITTIDKNYPVIADCHIDSADTYLHSDYNGTNVYHYVGVIGYDDRPQIIPAEVYIVDSWGRIGDRVYWTSLDQLTRATDEYGIIW